MKKVFLFLIVSLFMFNACKKDDSNPLTPATDTIIYEGKSYHTVKIENQVWLKENLDVGVYVASTNTGQTHSNASNNGIIEKYCYGNIESNCATYGGLYDWNEAMNYIATAGPKGICPAGWHIPSYAEFKTLKAVVSSTGNSLKEIGQGTGNGQGTNTSGFSALLGGYRGHDGFFYGLAAYTVFWSSSEYNIVNAHTLHLSSDDSSIHFYDSTKEGGFSVRCVKD